MTSFEAKASASNKNKVSNQNALLSLMSQDDFNRVNNEIHSYIANAPAILKNQILGEQIVEERSSFDCTDGDGGGADDIYS